MKRLLAICTMVGFLSGVAAMAHAEKIKEYPIDSVGKNINGMNIAAVYLLPIDMEPRGTDLPASQADIHLEADIHAIPGNKNGFGAGEWVPHLTVSYTLSNLDTGATKKGNFMPMVAKDGPHYGSNIKMMGAGNYKVTFNIENPSKQGFGRHTDTATGVGKWFQPFSVDYKFKFVPLK
ncbi:MAG TPA: iron transporter [Syntrophus sp. (in: bacteria)]|nr:iron transporter [Syntrophus sp. (in: bacteria)]